MNIKTEITKMHYDKNAKGVLFNVLKFSSIFYGIVVGAKNFLYDKKILKPKKVDAYVISIGNFTTGGVGKTPVVAELARYYVDKGERVAIVSRGYGGKLNIRPAFQREFVYKEKQRNAVIETVVKGFPLNVMYWVEDKNGNYELLDGQQRTISICQYVNGDFSLNSRAFHNLTETEKNQIFV